jgi:hypothetical protein
VPSFRPDENKGQESLVEWKLGKGPVHLHDAAAVNLAKNKTQLNCYAEVASSYIRHDYSTYFDAISATSSAWRASKYFLLALVDSSLNHCLIGRSLFLIGSKRNILFQCGSHSGGVYRWLEYLFSLSLLTHMDQVPRSGQCLWHPMLPRGLVPLHHCHLSTFSGIITCICKM